MIESDMVENIKDHVLCLYKSGVIDLAKYREFLDKINNYEEVLEKEEKDE